MELKNSNKKRGGPQGHHRSSAYAEIPRETIRRRLFILRLDGETNARVFHNKSVARVDEIFSAFLRAAHGFQDNILMFKAFNN
jgi:hypothetical protein